jgi:hypothetical protein
MKIPIQYGQEYGHWKLPPQVTELLLECRAKESTRYAINGIRVGEGVLVATDGRRLIEVKTQHKIPEGNYFCTTDGFLLDGMEGNFPNHQSIFPNKDELRKIVEVDSGCGEEVIGLILGELCHVGCIVKLLLYQRPIEILSEILEGKTKAYVHSERPAESPFIIEAETSLGDIRYIQMPVGVENNVEKSS